MKSCNWQNVVVALSYQLSAVFTQENTSLSFEKPMFKLEFNVEIERKVRLRGVLGCLVEFLGP